MNMDNDRDYIDPEYERKGYGNSELGEKSGDSKSLEHSLEHGLGIALPLEAAGGVDELSATAAIFQDVITIQL